MKCAKCKIAYPEGYLSPIIGGSVRGGVCGICALEITNEVHGVTREKFQGEIAEELRQMAIEYRKRLVRGE